MKHLHTQGSHRHTGARLPHYGSERQGMLAVLARSLGWFSVGLGAAQLLAPRLMGRATGLEGREELLRAYGARGLVSGLAILALPDPRLPVWARLAGDVLDAGTLLSRMAAGGRGGRKAGLALLAVAPVAFADLVCAKSLSDRARGKRESPDFGNRSGFPGGLPSGEGPEGAGLADQTDAFAGRSSSVPTPTQASSGTTAGTTGGGGSGGGKRRNERVGDRRRTDQHAGLGRQEHAEAP